MNTPSAAVDKSMKRVLVTGADGFVGTNLRVAMRRRPDIEVLPFDITHAPHELDQYASVADFVFHLAGVNRPKDPSEFVRGNVELTARLLSTLTASGKRTPVVFSSSIQATLDNPYGISKRRAEELLLDYHRRTGAPVRIFRFPNIFGKWSRPNYNSVVSTFCYSISHGLPVAISNPENKITLVYIDEVVRCLLQCLSLGIDGAAFGNVDETYVVTVGELYSLLNMFREQRLRNEIPDLASAFARYLYATYLSYLDPDQRVTMVELRKDERGWLFELLKSPHAGQIFISRTRPGITRGRHYHDTKVEKFCVVKGRGRIRVRPVLGGDVLVYDVSDDPICVLDIPVGCVHSIENTGGEDMITVFWASEIYDPQRADTYVEEI